jgi:hypothetical protein
VGKREEKSDEATRDHRRAGAAPGCHPHGAHDIARLAANDELTTVIDNLRTWAKGILAAVATLFLTIGGVRYLLAGGNPRAVEAKGAIKNAVIGYVLAAVAPAILGVVRQIVGH